MANRRWQEPSTVDGRRDFRNLRKELRKAGSKKRREELTAQLDALYGRGTEPHSLRQRTENELDGEARKSILCETEPPQAPPYPPLPAGDIDRAKFAKTLDAAKAAIEPQLKAKVLYIDDTVTSVAEAHAKFGYEIKTGRNDWDSMEHAERVAFTTFQLRIWRKAPLFDRPTWANAAWELFMGKSAVEKLREHNAFESQNLAPEQWNKIFDQLGIEKKMNEVMDEKYFTSPEAQTASAENTPPAQQPELVAEKPAPARDPIAAASANLSARAALLLQSDSWLSRLAQHSDEMHSRIIAGLSQELLRSGFVNGEFAAKLYNDLRPRALGAFPERKF